MIVVTAFTQLKPEAREQAMEAVRTLQAASAAESGCSAYRFYTAVDDDCALATIENWSDIESLQAHFGSPHMAEISALLPDLLAGPLNIVTYDATQVEMP